MEMTTKRRVRKDFDPKHPISVDVSGCTEEEKEEVQQAFFDVGIKWESGVARFRYLNAELYANSTIAGTCYDHLMYGILPRKDSISRQQFLSMVYEVGQQGHIHAHLMALYAEDAKTNKTPWVLWEFKDFEGSWIDCKRSPVWSPSAEYRRKPKTRTVNGVEILDLSFIPSVGEMYYYPNPILYKWATDDLYREDCKFTRRLIELNLCYPFTDEGKQAAIAHSKAMLGIA